MKRSEALQSLIQNEGADTFRNIAFTLFNDRCEAAAIHELKEDPKTLAVIEGVVAPNDVVVVFAHLHNSEFIPDYLSFLCIFRFDKFKCELLSIVLALYQENTSETSVAYFLHDFIILRWVFLAELSRLFKFRCKLILCRKYNNIIIAVLLEYTSHFSCFQNIVKVFLYFFSFESCKKRLKLFRCSYDFSEFWIEFKLECLLGIHWCADHIGSVSIFFFDLVLFLLGGCDRDETWIVIFARVELSL